MNKYLKIGLIAVPCGLVVWLLYKTAKGFSKNAIAKDEKIKNQQAETEVDKIRNEANEGYISKGQQEQQEKNKQLAEVQKSKGFATREEYVQYLRENEQSLKKEYGSGVADHYLRNIEIHVSEYGVDPGNISYDALQERIDMLQDWKKQAAEYRQLTGEQVSISNSNFDTVEEMEAAVISAKAEIEKAKEALQKAWDEEYMIFASDDNVLGKSCKMISQENVQKWLLRPQDLAGVKLKMTDAYNNWACVSQPKLEKIKLQLKNLFTDEHYIVWKSGAKKSIKYVGSAVSLLSLYRNLSVPERIYLDNLLGDGKILGSVAYDVKDKNNFSSKYRKPVYNMNDAARCVVSLSKAVKSNNNRKEWESIESLSRNVVGLSVNEFGLSLPDGPLNALKAYSQNLYGYSDSDFEKIENGQIELSDIVSVEE